MINELAEIAGEAIANKVMNRKKNNLGISVYGRLFKMVTQILDNPEGAEVNLKCIGGDIKATVWPEGSESKKGFIARISVFGDEKDAG